MVRFDECEDPATQEQIDFAEEQLGLRFPARLKELFLTCNGGTPHPYVYRDGRLETVVIGTLPLRAGRGSAFWTYSLFVEKKRLVPRYFFPFAIDGGANTLFVDCSTPDGRVYLYLIGMTHDNTVALDVGFDEFWDRLAAE